MRKISFLLILLFGTAAFSQKQGQPLIDSLLLELPKTKQDTTRAALLRRIAYSLPNIDPEKGKQYGKEALKLSESLQWNDGIAAALNAIGKNYAGTGDFNQALTYYNRAFPKTKNKKILGFLLNDFALSYANLGNYIKSLDYYHRALKMAEERYDKKLQGAVLSNMGLVYFGLEKYDEAIALFHKALKINTSIGNKINMSRNLGNLGNAYSILGDDKKAIGYYQRALEINRSYGDKANTAIVIGAIGNSYFRLKEYHKALQYASESMKLTEALGDQYVIAFNHGLIGDIYFQMAKHETNPQKQKILFRNGETDFRKALEIHQKLNNLKEIMYDYQNLSAIQKKTGNFSEALDSYEKSIVYKDSIFNADNKETIKNLEDKRAIELRDKQIQLNKVTLESKERQKWFYILGIVALLVIGALILWQSQNRKKTNEKLQQLNAGLDEANKVKVRFLGIINHDLKSPVASLISFLHIQKEHPEMLDEQMQDKTISSAENLLESMEDILLWSKGQMDHFKPEFRKVNVDWLFDDLKKNFFHVNSVRFVFENPGQAEWRTDENYLKTILRNLMANAVKAVENIPDATVTVKAGPSYLSVSDNGPGGNSEQFRALHDDSVVSGMQSGMGLHLIRDMAKAIGCSITVDTKPGEGTTFKITFA
ncbi:MAG TPA: tetratricopeptide repeat-containing sensor histidine kinase [Flavobacterium sp.]|nr:tetratricopeptide repeat-containing sensor histidine kinase [Flavobacterium sp.]